MSDRPSLAHLNRRSFLQWTAVGLAAPGVLAEACGGSASPAPATATQKPSGSLSIYSALNQSTNDAFVAAFKAATPGVEVSLLPLAAAGDLQTRITTEKANPKADVFIGGSSEFHDPLGKQGLLVAYKSPNAKLVSAAYKEASGLWTGWYLGIFGFVTNTQRASEVKIPKPATWDDLLDPSWKGKLILPDPLKTGGGYIFLATQVFRFNRDEAKALDYMKKLNVNVKQYIASSPAAIQNVAQGQFVGAPNWAHDILTSKSQGNPIDLSVPKQTANEVGAVSIVKGGPNKSGAAQAFVDWVLTKDAGALNVKLSNRLSTRPDVPPAPGAPTLKDVDIVAYDRQWATDNKTRLLQAWQQAIGG